VNRVRQWLPSTLFGRTALALAGAFLLFGFISAVLLQVTLVRPYTKQAADDLAAFLVLAAQIWVELPPFTRADYERELTRRHQMRVMRTETAQAPMPSTHDYLRYLEQALSGHVNQPVTIHRHPEHPGWLWADFPMGGRLMRLGFREDRLHEPLLVILPFLGALGLFIAFVVAVLLVRHITRPLAQMREAAQRIGEGAAIAPIAETGPTEIAELARKLNRMEGQIAELLQARTTLLAGISHDLRTPLARMRLELEFIRGGENTALVDEMNENIDEMDSLITQALALARSLGRQEPEETDVTQLLAEIADAFQRAGDDVRLDTQSPCVLALPAESLGRVLHNLIENAINYGERQPVKIACDLGDDALEISVTDRGPGVPVSERTRIFQPFFRLEGSRNPATGGTGLGLAVVAQLCRANGWSVEVATPPEGRGSVFRVIVPTGSAVSA
jgi:two-component system osmolarity sensor histidine kinase EnvZ